MNKCLTFEARKAAYDLLLHLIETHPEEIGVILNDHWYHIVHNIAKPKKPNANATGTRASSSVNSPARIMMMVIRAARLAAQPHC